MCLDVMFLCNKVVDEEENWDKDFEFVFLYNGFLVYSRCFIYVGIFFLCIYLIKRIYVNWMLSIFLSGIGIFINKSRFFFLWNL